MLAGHFDWYNLWLWYIAHEQVEISLLVGVRWFCQKLHTSDFIYIFSKFLMFFYAKIIKKDGLNVDNIGQWGLVYRSWGNDMQSDMKKSSM